MSQMQDALKYFAGKRMKGMTPPEGYLSTVLEAARKYQDILDTDIGKWIEAEAQIARANGELDWNRVHQSQAENLLAALAPEVAE